MKTAKQADYHEQLEPNSLNYLCWRDCENSWRQKCRFCKITRQWLPDKIDIVRIPTPKGTSRREAFDLSISRSWTYYSRNGAYLSHGEKVPKCRAPKAAQKAKTKAAKRKKSKV